MVGWCNKLPFMGASRVCLWVTRYVDFFLYLPKFLVHNVYMLIISALFSRWILHQYLGDMDPGTQADNMFGTENW